MSEPFVGEIKQFGFNFNPRGYAYCAGQLLPISQNQALFALIGTYFGGNGTSNFQLPDLQGRVTIGQGAGAGLPAYNLGTKGGAAQLSLTTANMPSHNHGIAYTTQPSINNLTAQTTINAYTRPTARTDSPQGSLLSVSQDAVTGNNVNAYATAGNAATLATNAAVTQVSAQFNPGTLVVQPNGGSQPFSITPPFVAITYCIALLGVFPVRS